LVPALFNLQSKIGENAFVVPFLNGIDVYSRVRSVIKNGIVFPNKISFGTRILGPGKVSQRGGDRRILLGPDPQHPEFLPNELFAVFEEAKIEFAWTTSIQSEIWKKFIFISGYALVSAAFNKTMREILDDAEARKVTEEIIFEAISIANGLGVSLPADIAQQSLLRAQDFPRDAKTSFQRDFERPDKMDERDLFAGSMIRLADDLGIEIPKTKKILAFLEQSKPLRSITQS
jgi:2-dehydropantoate 2-reductase